MRNINSSRDTTYICFIGNNQQEENGSLEPIEAERSTSVNTTTTYPTLNDEQAEKESSASLAAEIVKEPLEVDLVQPSLFNLPAEMREIIMQHIYTSSEEDMLARKINRNTFLAFSEVNKDAFATRFHCPSLQHFHFNTAQLNQFLSYCQSLEQIQAPLRQIPDFCLVKTLSLTLSEKLSLQQAELLFKYLSGIQHLEITLSKNCQLASLGMLLKAVQALPLEHLRIAKEIHYMNKDVLPEELWQLTSLSILKLENIDIHSLSEEISHLQALTSLTLKKSPIRALPDSLWTLEKLEQLTLETVGLTALPEEIGKLQSLTSLTLADIGIEKLPDSLWGLEKLEQLTLNILRLTALPEKISHLQALTSLTLQSLPIKELPDSLWTLEKLEQLTLEALSLTALPKEVSNLQALASLTLGSMEIEKVPESLGNLKALASLCLAYMKNIQVLPDSLGKLQALKHLALLSNKRLTTLPEGIGRLHTLRSLNLQFTPIRELPVELSDLPHLQEIHVWEPPYIYVPTALKPYVKTHNINL